MFVSFNPQNYSRANFSTQRMNFNGRIPNAKPAITEITAKILAKLDEMAQMEAPKRELALNDIATTIFNNRAAASDDIVRKAMILIPEEDANYSASKYAVELKRLAKYSNVGKNLMTEVDTAIKSAKLGRSMESTVEGFKSTGCNKLGIPVKSCEAQGVVYFDSRNKGRRLHGPRDDS